MPLHILEKVKIAVVNLMPNQLETQMMWTTILMRAEPNIAIDFIRMESHKASEKSETTNRTYQTLEEVKDNHYQGMVITGAPVEKMDFSQVDYWEEFQALLSYSKSHAASTLFVCWAAQAALYSRYGIEKKVENQKIFGIYDNRIIERSLLMKGFGSGILVPQSRYAGNDLEKIIKEDKLLVYALSLESGSYVIEDKVNKSIYISGHPEYDLDSLEKEYLRDQKKGISVLIPTNYYEGKQPEGEIRKEWKQHSQLFFHNWIEVCKKNSGKPKTFELVSKFGGTSLADATQFRKVKKIIEQEKCKNVVVSAPGKRFPTDEKVTDLLCKCFEAIEQKACIEQIVNEIKKRFMTLCEQLMLKEEIGEKVEEVMEKILHSKDRDYIISRGEFLNGVIMAEYLGYSFVDAKEVIFFDELGQLDEMKTYQAMKHKLKGKQSVVIPGFYGSSFEGGIKTFARGGSDITGSLLASGLQADLYQNWSDVDGVMTADPKLDKSASLITQMTYEELVQIAKEGACIYHLDAVSYVSKAGIPLCIRNTNRPEQEGTLIIGEGGNNYGR